MTRRKREKKVRIKTIKRKRKNSRRIKRQYGGALPEDIKKILTDSNIIGDVDTVSEFVNTMIQTKHFLIYPLKSKEEMEKEEKEREKRRKKKAKKPGFFGRLTGRITGLFGKKKPDQDNEEEEEEEIEDFDLKKETDYENIDEEVRFSSHVNNEIQLVTLETDTYDIFAGFFYIKTIPQKKIRFSLDYTTMELTITVGSDSEVFK